MKAPVVWMFLVVAGGFAFGQQNVDLIVSHGIVVTMDGARAIYQEGAVAVRGDSIVAVGPQNEVESLDTRRRR